MSLILLGFVFYCSINDPSAWMPVEVSMLHQNRRYIIIRDLGRPKAALNDPTPEKMHCESRKTSNWEEGSKPVVIARSPLDFRLLATMGPVSDNVNTRRHCRMKGESHTFRLPRDCYNTGVLRTGRALFPAASGLATT